MIVEARKLAPRDVKLSCDVAIVGSGAGGAVMATELAEAGLDVLVLEEGGWTPPEVYAKLKVSESLKRLGREAGASSVIPVGDTPVIGVMMGRTVGGSSVMTGGVCFRIPAPIAETWAKAHGLRDLAPQAMERHYAKVERAMNVGEVAPEMRSRAITLFDEGAEKKGFRLKSMRRNTRGCVGHSRCNFGCPVGAKLSVDVSYLPRAIAKGARVWADCLVDRVVVRGGRAAGVEGRILNRSGSKPGNRFSVEAKAVVVAAGTLHTPLVLARSGVGVGRGVLGRGVTLHPSFRVAALFDEEVRGWDGSFQAAFSDHYEHEGVTLNAAFPPLNIVAAAIPGVGKSYVDGIRKLGHLSVFGALVHDGPGGRLLGRLGREPLLWYRLDPEDKAKMMRAMRIMAEIYFEAGAKQILLPIFGAPPVTSIDGLKKLDEKIPASLIETISFHPLGSARMGTYERSSIVQSTGETWDLPGLWVADGSVFPSSIGVNSQLPIMAMATRIAENFLGRWRA